VENLFYYNPRPVPSPSTPSLRFVLKLTEIFCIKVDSNSEFHLRRLTRDLAKGALKKHDPRKFWTFWRYSDQFLEILRSIFYCVVKIGPHEQRLFKATHTNICVMGRIQGCRGVDLVYCPSFLSLTLSRSLARARTRALPLSPCPSARAPGTLRRTPEEEEEEGSIGLFWWNKFGYKTRIVHKFYLLVCLFG